MPTAYEQLMAEREKNNKKTKTAYEQLMEERQTKKTNVPLTQEMITAAAKEFKKSPIYGNKIEKSKPNIVIKPASKTPLNASIPEIKMTNVGQERTLKDIIGKKEKPNIGDTLFYNTIAGASDVAKGYLNIPILAEKLIGQGINVAKNFGGMVGHDVKNKVSDIVNPPTMAERLQRKPFVPKKQQELPLSPQTQSLENMVKRIETNQAIIDKFNAKAPKLQQYLGTGIRSAVAAAPALATGNIVGSAPAMFGIQFGSNYARDAEKEGATPLQSAAYGSIMGAVESLSGKYLDNILKGVGGKKALITAIKNINSEGLQEVISNPISAISKRAIYGSDKDPIVNLQRELDSYVGGALTAGMFAGGAGLISRVGVPKTAQQTVQGVPTDTARMVEPEIVDKINTLAKDRLQQLESKGKEKVGMVNGEQKVIGPKEFLTLDEIREREFLRNNIDNPQAIANAYRIEQEEMPVVQDVSQTPSKPQTVVQPEQISAKTNKFDSSYAGLKNKAIYVNGQMLYPSDLANVADEIKANFDASPVDDTYVDRGHDLLYLAKDITSGNEDAINEAFKTPGVHITKSGDSFSLRYDEDGFLQRNGMVTKEDAFNNIFDAVSALKNEGHGGKLDIPELKYKGTINDFLGKPGNVGAIESKKAAAEVPKVEPKQVQPEKKLLYEPETSSVNKKTWYHGTNIKELTADNLDPFTGSHESLLGHGIYLTDNPEIAEKYANTRSKRSGEPVVYQAKTNVNKVLDFEKPLPDDAIKSIRNGSYEQFKPVIDEIAKDKNITGTELFGKLKDAVSEESNAEMIPTSEYVEMFQDINSELRKLGYDAITHIGGKVTGGKEHQVLIPLDPNDSYSQVGRKGQITEFKPYEKKSEAIAPVQPEPSNLMPETEVIQSGLQGQERQGETEVNRPSGQELGIVAKPKLPFLNQVEPRAKTMVVNETSEVSPTLNKIVTNKKGRMPMRTLWDNFYQKFINNQHYIGLAQKTVGQVPANKDMAIMAANSRNAPGTINHILREALITKEGKEIGNSYKTIIDSVPKKYEQEFNDYLLHRHNIGRMSLQENAEAKVREFELGNPSLASLNDAQLKKLSEVNGDEGVAAKEYLGLIKSTKKSQNKPVFGNNVTPEMSEQQIAKYEAKFPDFKRIADQYDSFNQKFMREWAVKTGLISEDTMKHLNEIYPHYAPTYRAMEETAATQIRPGKGFVNQPNVLKKATGSERPILNPLETTMQLIDKTVKTAKYNEVGQTIVDAIRKNPEGMKEWGEIVKDPGTDLISDTGKTLENSDISETMDNLVSQYDKPKLNGKNIVRVMENGQPVYLKINKPEFLESITGLINYKPGEAEKIARMVTTPYKALITGKNPIFAVKNISRDIPTAYINGSEKNPFKFIRNLSEAAKDMATNAESYREYKALGGGNSGFFLEGKGRTSNLKKLYKGEGVVSQFNESIESLPRYAEYRRTVKRGGGDYASKMQGLFNANELTVNFARHGNVTKSADAFVPYLNPGVQGIDKLARQFQKHPLATVGKGILIVTIPQIALNLINRDNDEYKKLDNRTKDNYYLIPNVTDGGKTFIKIPKSREYGVIFADTFDRIQRGLKGDQHAFDGYWTTIKTNFAPTNIFTNNVISPIVTNLPSNKDFAGRTIVPQGIQARSPKYQYDENTSEISKAIGQKLNISPKQADYLIKTYTGVIGTFTLPMTTKSSKGTMQQILGNTISRNFTADPVFSNDIVNRFYEQKKKAETVKADAKFNNKELSMAEDNKRHQYNVAASEISKIYDQIGVAKTDEEKRNLRKQINEIAKIATESPVDDEVKETKNDVLEKLGIEPESKQKFY